MSDNKAQFNFYLNRQGVTGKQGAKGEKGFSPVISVEKDTLSEYILRITNESSYFLTTNLRESKEDRGGTYIRYDRDQGVMYAGDADRANKTQYGEVRFATPEEIAAGDESTVITPADLEDATANMVTVNTDQTITGNKSFSAPIKTNTIEATDGTSLLSLRGGKVSLGTPANVSSPLVSNVKIKGHSINIAGKNFTFTDLLNSPNITYTVLHSGNLKNYIQAGENITIDKTSTGITISSTGGGQVSEDVALKSADQTFTGHNYFNGQVSFNGTVQFPNQQVNIPKLYSSNKITGANISLESAGQSFKFPCEKGTMSLSATSGDETGTSAGLYITGAGIDNKRLLTEGDACVLPQANATTLGGVKANPKTHYDTQAVNIDPATGLLYTKAGGGESNNTVFNSVSPIFINQDCNPYIDNNGFYILENSYNNDGINNITVNGHFSVNSLPDRGTVTLNIQNVTDNKTDWDNNVLGFDITNPNNAKIYAGDAIQDFAKFIVLCNKSGNNVTPLYIAVGDDSRVKVGSANSCLLNNIEFQNIQDNKGIYNANMKQKIDDTPYEIQDFFVTIIVDLNIIQLMCVGTDGEEHLLYNVSGLTDLANINYAYILSGSDTAKFNEDTVYSIVDEQKIYPTIIRNATDVNISLKYSDKFILNNETLDLANTITTQGNTFNGANQLVQLDSTGKLPAIDGSQLTNLQQATVPANMATTDTDQTITGFKTHLVGGSNSNAGNIYITDNVSYGVGNRLHIDNQSVKIADNARRNGYYAASYGSESLYLNDNRQNSSSDYFVISTTRTGGTRWTIGWANAPSIIITNSLKRKDNYSSKEYNILDASNLGDYVDGTTITYTDGKLKASGGSTPSNMVTTNTPQDITTTKTFVDTAPLKLRNTSISKTACPIRLWEDSVYGNKILLGDCPDEGASISGLPVAIVVPGANKTIYKAINNDLNTLVPILDKENFSSVAPTGNLKYWTGIEEAYTGLATKDADTLYRTTDTNKVYLGTIQIGGNA